jgi:DHA2 family multidrug resistance protein
MMLTAVVVLATIMQTLDMTIANVAVPHMQGSLSASQDQIMWVLTSYVVAAAVSLPLTNFLVSRFGRRRVYAVSTLSFTIASALCGMAQTLEQVVIFRAVQGAVGALLVPIGQAVLMDVFPREKHGLAMSWWGVGGMVGPLIGPTLGGYLTEYFSWRWVFYINVPVGTLAAIGILMLIPESARNTKIRFDYLGFILIAVALGLLQLALDRGTTLDWLSSNQIVISLLIAALAFYAFVVHILTAPAPFLTPRIFKDPNLLYGSIAGFFCNLGLFSALAAVPLMLQSLMGYPVLTTGYLLLPRGVGTLIAMFSLSYLTRQFDTRVVITFGTIIAGLTLWHMSTFTTDVSDMEVMANGFVHGIAMGLLVIPLVMLASSTLTPALRTEGIVFVALARNMGGSIGISITSTLLARLTQTNHAQLVEHVTPFRHVTDISPEIIARGVGAVAAIEAEVTRQATMIAYIDIFRLMAYLLICVAFIIPFMRSPKVASSEAVPVEI